MESHVVTGADRRETRNDWASRDRIDGTLVPGAVGTVGRVLVGVRDERKIDRMADLVDLIDRERIIHITLLHVAPETGTARDDPQKVPAAMKSELVERGVNPAAIDTRVRKSDDPAYELTAVARSHDLTVLGGTREKGLEDRVFGSFSNWFVDEAESAVLIVD